MYILLTKVTAAQIEVAISHYKVRGLYFKAVIFAASIVCTIQYTAYSIENTLSSSTSHIEFNPFQLRNSSVLGAFCKYL